VAVGFGAAVVALAGALGAGTGAGCTAASAGAAMTSIRAEMPAELRNLPTIV